MDSKSLYAASTAVDKLCVLVLANNMYEEEGLFGGSRIQWSLVYQKFLFSDFKRKGDWRKNCLGFCLMHNRS